MPFEAYIGYLSEKESEIAAGAAFALEVRDLDTYERKIVRAQVGKPGTVIENGDELWVLDWVEARQSEPWSIKVLEELDEEDATGLRSDISETDLRAQAEDSQRYASGRGRGAGMPEMMGQEEARKFYENMVARKLGDKK